MVDNQEPLIKKNSYLKKDYQQKSFVNPYFDKEKKKRTFNTKRYLKILFFIFVMYLVVYSDLFKIKEVEVYGTDMIKKEEFVGVINQELSNWSWYVLPKRNFLFLNKKRLAEKIENQYHLQKIEFRRQNKTLIITIEEKVSYLIVYNIKDQYFYFMDIDGAIVKNLDAEEVKTYWSRFPILNLNEEKINIGDKFVSRKVVAFILELDKELKNKPISVQGYEKMSTTEVALVTKTGWRAYFSIDSDIKKTVENLLTITKEKSDELKNIQYIDLRFGDKIFYK